MNNPQTQIILQRKKASMANAEKFLTQLSEYMKSDAVIKQFHESDRLLYGPFKPIHILSCSWNTGDVFSIEFIKEIEIINRNWLEFRFRRKEHYWKEENLNQMGEVFYRQIDELQPTDFMFYVQYIGTNFNVRNTKIQSSEIDDFGFITDQILEELAK